MAVHPNLSSMLKESLPELLHTVKYCLTYRKEFSSDWGLVATGGVLGFPAINLLMSIIDTIGSYHKGQSIVVDGVARPINSASSHFFILNHLYFTKTYSLQQLREIYDVYRCKPIHNSALPGNRILALGNVADAPFVFQRNGSGIERLVTANLRPLYEMCEKAASAFLKDVDTVIPGSPQESEINKKSITPSKTIDASSTGRP